MIDYITLINYIGRDISDEKIGDHYVVKSNDNGNIILSTIDEDNAIVCPEYKISPHVGHNISCVYYGDYENISIECEDCCEVIHDETRREDDR